MADAKHGTVTVEISIDTRRLDTALRRVGRSLRQGERNAQTRPASAERRAIQRLGTSQLEAAAFWLRQRVMDTWLSLGLPACATETTPGGAHGSRVFVCALEPDHYDQLHLSKEGISWPM